MIRNLPSRVEGDDGNGKDVEINSLQSRVNSMYRIRVVKHYRFKTVSLKAALHSMSR